MSEVRYSSLDCYGFPNARVGDDGTVQTLRKGVWKDRKPGKLNNGYKTVNLRKGGKVHYFLISRLVLMAFVGPCPEGMECCHNNGDHRDNRLANLRWDTRKANSHDRFTHGTVKYGEQLPSTKNTEEEIREIRRLYATGRFTQRELADRYGLKSQMSISRIVNRKVWKTVA